MKKIENIPASKEELNKLGSRIYCESLTEFANASAKKFISAVNEKLAIAEECNVAISGGKTPLHMFHKLASDYNAKTDWRRINFFWADERCVSPDDPESNFGNAYREFLDKVSVKNYFRMEGELKPSTAARRYEKLIQDKFKLKKSQFPVFDLICLGMGNDGHTASLFPDSELLKEKKKLVASAFVKQAGQYRITLTLPVLRNAKRRLFLVAGKEKIEILNKIFSGTKEKYPVQKLFPSKGENTWIIG